MTTRRPPTTTKRLAADYDDKVLSVVGADAVFKIDFARFVEQDETGRTDQAMVQPEASSIFGRCYILIDLAYDWLSF